MAGSENRGAFSEGRETLLRPSCRALVHGHCAQHILRNVLRASETTVVRVATLCGGVWPDREGASAVGRNVAGFVPVEHHDK